MKTSEQPVVVEQLLPASREQVWKAITDREEMIQWYFDNIPEFKAEVGFKTGFLIEHDGRQFPHQWEVLEVVPLERITYRWTFANYPGVGDVTFALSETEDGTIVTLTDVVVEDYPDDVPEFKRESCQKGWEYFIQGQLKAYIEKK